MPQDDTPRVVVTSLEAPGPQKVYADLYGAWGTCDNARKAVTGALHSDRTSATTFLAHAMRLLLSCAASVLHHALRTSTRSHTTRATAQPSQDRMRLHLPTSCPVKALLHRVTTLLSAVPVPALHTS
jgi:Transposase DDE domain group 1